ncbi:cell wall aminitransferase [Candidatus Planktophila lacus]|uniref:DegT/DnrJ/EryC1/StrS family aminotransferase n=1 Tax=Candidatus Planktophila lacus TaxID=1884913 RepID=UPI000BACCE2E|nr:DegT/DnrJ/EryC1/StrS family aminotransferase [Candidatus Planktophila lacus]ASY24519.1 cell wall aminitransferase [Candidatus Planktophila lacus]
MKYPLIRPDVPEPKFWINQLNSAYEESHFSNGGRIWQEFNKKVVEKIRASAAVGVANNTVGQVAALHAVEISDQLVFISNFTFPATLQAVHMAGGIPVICDTDDWSWEISLDSVKSGIKMFGKPKAVVVTRVFGQRLNHAELIDFLASENIELIFDSAAAFPLAELNKNTETLREVYSLHATKAFGIGEGGIVTGPDRFIKSVWKHSNFGFTSPDEFSDGNNAKMDEFAAARGIAALDKLPETSEKRKKFIKDTYSGIFESSGYRHIDINSDQLWSLFPVQFKQNEELSIFSNHLLQKEILSKKYYSPSMSKGYKGNAKMLLTDDLRNSENAANTVLCLPVYSTFTSEETEYIRESVKEAFEKVMDL